MIPARRARVNRFTPSPGEPQGVRFASAPNVAAYDGAMPLRIAMIAAECEPWAKTGGLGDVVDALARALGRVPGATDGDVEVFLPRYRSVEIPAAATTGRRSLRVPDTQAPDGATDLTVIDVAANGYRLRLV